MYLVGLLTRLQELHCPAQRLLSQVSKAIQDASYDLQHVWQQTKRLSPLLASMVSYLQWTASLPFNNNKIDYRTSPTHFTEAGSMTCLICTWLSSWNMSHEKEIFSIPAWAHTIPIRCLASTIWHIATIMMCTQHRSSPLIA